MFYFPLLWLHISVWLQYDSTLFCFLLLRSDDLCFQSYFVSEWALSKEEYIVAEH